ncbi:hypothetical protein [Undibacterium sp. Tian12W]|uniref:hypothetical protein n=1 Tax=Undibacterium sp. Tian12W TaxID=3413054 RepID=UPI003BF03B81
MTQYIPAIVTIITALIGGGLLLYVHKRNAYRTAATSFRAAFAPALARIEAARLHNSTHDAPDVSGLLNSNFEVMAAAVANFSPFVAGKEKKAFDEAWHEYKELNPTSYGGAMFFAGYENKDSLMVIEKKLNAILAFAKISTRFF